MNYHTDEWIMSRLQEHYEDALKLYPEENIVGIFCYGSQNYNMDNENSDIDTKLFITPTLKEISLSWKPASYTYTRDNKELIDVKDIRKFINLACKQNPSFLEILFTKYYIINPLYKNEWDEIIRMNEEIAHINPSRAIKSIFGTLTEKRNAVINPKPHPSREEIFKEFDYDPKDLVHEIRLKMLLTKYINNEPYSRCLIPDDADMEKLQFVASAKLPANPANAYYSAAKDLTDEALKKIVVNEDNQEIIQKLEDITYKIIKKSILNEMMKG